MVGKPGGGPPEIRLMHQLNIVPFSGLYAQNVYTVLRMDDIQKCLFLFNSTNTSLFVDGFGKSESGFESGRRQNYPLKVASFLSLARGALSLASGEERQKRTTTYNSVP